MDIKHPVGQSDCNAVADLSEGFKLLEKHVGYGKATDIQSEHRQREKSVAKMQVPFGW